MGTQGAVRDCFCHPLSRMLVEAVTHIDNVLEGIYNDVRTIQQRIRDNFAESQADLKGIEDIYFQVGDSESKMSTIFFKSATWLR